MVLNIQYTLPRRKLNKLAHRVSSSLVRKILHQAFVDVRREGLKLRVSQIDNERMIESNDDGDPTRINVIVRGGIVQKSWVG